MLGFQWLDWPRLFHCTRDLDNSTLPSLWFRNAHTAWIFGYNLPPRGLSHQRCFGTKIFINPPHPFIVSSISCSIGRRILSTAASDTSGDRQPDLCYNFALVVLRISKDIYDVTYLVQSTATSGLITGLATYTSKSQVSQSSCVIPSCSNCCFCAKRSATRFWSIVITLAYYRDSWFR